MRAVIMAGGEGTRLRPISAGRPKPMVSLLDRPVMEHIICLLRKYGICDIKATLQYMPHIITEYFGDGRRLDVKLDYCIENEPLGTAGSVKNCGAFVSESDFFVISGDAVCDFNLESCMKFHKEKNADITVVLYRHPKPLEYGVVMTAKDGKIERFIEKPSWNQVFANTVNTGIYIIKPHIMDKIPDGEPFDFARDLFPLLLKENYRLYGYTASGYWCDIGDCEAYLNCCADVLSGNARIFPGPVRTAPGIYGENGRRFLGVNIIPPCFIGPDVTIENGAVIGPHTVIGAGSRIGAKSLVQRSVIDGARIGSRAALYGAVVCKNAIIKNNAVLNEGSVIGESTVIGRDCLVMERARVWPNKEIPDFERVGGNILSGSLKSTLSFSEGSEISGEINIDLTADACVCLGAASALYKSAVGIAHTGGDGARILAAALKAGLCSAGADVLEYDAPVMSAAVFAASVYTTPLSIFVSQKGENITIRFFDESGLPLTREKERKIELTVKNGDFRLAGAAGLGSERKITGICDIYKASALSYAAFEGESRSHAAVGITKANISDRLLSDTLDMFGCKITRGMYGVPVFEVSDDGLRLSAADESGALISPDRILALLCLIEFKTGTRGAAVPYTAPGVVDIMAKSFGAPLLRLGRDSGAYELYKKQPFMHDGIFAALRIYAYMCHTGRTLEELLSDIPKFKTHVREISLRGDRGSVMRALAENCNDERELFEGLRIRSEKGFIHVSPITGRSALRVTGEGGNEEIAAELCDFIEGRAKMLDSAE